MIEAYKPGTMVEFSDEDSKDVQAVVLTVLIQSDNRVSYFVAYWANGTRQTAEVAAEEIFSKKDEEPLKIGFKS